jgi:hypothetical protein
MKTVLWLIGLSIFVCQCNQLNGELPEPPATETVVVSGSVQLGPVKGSLVVIYRLNDDGSKAEVLGTANTDADGVYRIEMLPNTGNIQIIVTGGSYAEEAGGDVIELSDKELHAMVDNIAQDKEVSVTALTHIASHRAKTLRNSGVSLEEAIVTARDEMVDAAGLENIYTAPANPERALGNADANARRYALFLAGLSKMATDQGTNSFEFTNAFMNDFKNDGEFDGLDNGDAILLGSSGAYLGNNDWSNDLDQAMDDYVGSGDNIAGFQLIDASDPVADSNVAIPTPTQSPISESRLDPQYFSLEATLPVAVGPCLPIQLVILDKNLSIVSLKESSKVVTTEAIDGSLAKLYDDSSCSQESPAQISVSAGLKKIPLYIKASSSGLIDFSKYHIQSDSQTQTVIDYLGTKEVQVGH